MFHKIFSHTNKVFAIIGFVIILAVAGVSFAQTPANKLKVLVIDKATNRPLKNKSVEIYSDNGVRCIKAPCPTNGIEWQGKTDKHGYLIVPAKIRQASMTIEISGYEAKELNRASQKVNDNRWIIVLGREPANN